MTNRFIRAYQRTVTAKWKEAEKPIKKARSIFVSDLNPYDQKRESARRRKQIANGSLRKENGLSVSS